jgi:hypothetical protein
MPTPNQVPKLQFPEMDPVFQQHYSQLIDTVNTLAGFNGEIGLNNHINLNGKRITGLGPPVAATDALASGIAEGKYSAAALKPSFEAGGSSAFSSYRQMNNQTQREQVSSYLTDLMSTPPSANSILPVFTNVSGGVQVYLPASIFKFADGSIQQLQSFTDNVPLGQSFTISSMSATGNIVTVNLSGPTGLVMGDYMNVAGVSPAVYNGSYPILSSTGGGATLTYENDSASGSPSGGTVSTGNIVYYGARKRSSAIYRIGSFSSDTQQQRLVINGDGFGIVAVVSISAQGATNSQSGAGATPIIGTPSAGSFF